MILPPMDVIAKWPKANYIDPERRGPGLIVTEITLLSITTVIILARVYTRLRIVKSFGLDDVLIICAVPPTVALVACTIIANTKYGWDRHVWDVTLPNISMGKKYALLTQCLFGAAVNFTKLSVLWFLKRLFKDSGSWIATHVKILLWAVAIVTPAYILMAVFQCRYDSYFSF
jgi:hypothetical protein